jgi:hypothetical protein
MTLHHDIVVGLIVIGVVAIVAIYFGRSFRGGADGDGFEMEVGDRPKGPRKGRRQKQR